MERRKEGKVMVVTSGRVRGWGGVGWGLQQAPMYQSVQGFCPFKRSSPRRINGKVIVIATTPKVSPKTVLSLHTKKAARR